MELSQEDIKRMISYRERMERRKTIQSALRVCLFILGGLTFWALVAWGLNLIYYVFPDFF